MTNYCIFLLGKIGWNFQLNSQFSFLYLSVFSTRFPTLPALFFTHLALQIDRFAKRSICIAQTQAQNRCTNRAEQRKRNAAFAFVGCSSRRPRPLNCARNMASSPLVQFAVFTDGNWKFHTWWWSTNWSTNATRKGKQKHTRTVPWALAVRSGLTAQKKIKSQMRVMTGWAGGGSERG